MNSWKICLLPQEFKVTIVWEETVDSDTPAVIFSARTCDRKRNHFVTIFIHLL
jgi:hypothetical protein